MTDSPRILIVEDDASIATGLAMNLRLEGYQPDVIHDGAEALSRLEEGQPELVLLDISLPNVDGLAILKELRGQGIGVPIIVISARADEFDKVAALRLGADDYVTKPFALAELMARVQAVLRRARPANQEEGRMLFEDFELSLAERKLRKAGVDLKLTHLEFELLAYLAQRPNQVVSREELLRSVWGVQPYGSKRTVDNFVAQLRSKLSDDRDSPRHLETVRGSGYRFIP